MTEANVTNSAEANLWNKVSAILGLLKKQSMHYDQEEPAYGLSSKDLELLEAAASDSQAVIQQALSSETIQERQSLLKLYTRFACLSRVLRMQFLTRRGIYDIALENSVKEEQAYVTLFQNDLRVLSEAIQMAAAEGDNPDVTDAMGDRESEFVS